jgi:hypothetical protein
VDWTGILIGAAIGNLIGGIITYLVSRHYYVRPASSLRREAEELKQQTQLIMRGLQEGLDIELNQDEQGNIIGVGIKLRAHIDGSSDVSGTVRDANEAPNDQE